MNNEAEKQFRLVHYKYTRTYWYINGRKVSHDIARHTWMMYLHKTRKEITSETMEHLYTRPAHILLEAGITVKVFTVYSGGKSGRKRAK